MEPLASTSRDREFTCEFHQASERRRAGGLGLWINVSSQVPLLVGIALGGIVAAWISAKNTKASAAAKVFNELLANLARDNDRSPAWDRRVSLAIALAQNERNDLARDLVKRCLDKLNPARVRSLTTMTLFRLQLLSKTYNLPIADPASGSLALKLLPAELRSRL